MYIKISQIRIVLITSNNKLYIELISTILTNPDCSE